MTTFRKPCGWGSWDRTDIRPPLAEWIVRDLTNGCSKAGKYPHSANYWNTIHWATPPWMNNPELWRRVKNIYKSARPGLDEVDHIVPLRGRYVSGLHVPWNLEVVPKEINQAKTNHHTHHELFDLFDQHVDDPHQMGLL